MSFFPQILTPFLLRRVKADVDLKIPPKKEVLVYCPMTDKQREMYEATVNKTIEALVNKNRNKKEEINTDSNTGRAKRDQKRFDYSVMVAFVIFVLRFKILI